MAKRNTIGLDQAPTRERRQSDNKLDTSRDESELVPISHKVPRHRKMYLKRLAISKSMQERDLLAEALQLLEDKYGDA